MARINPSDVRKIIDASVDIDIEPFINAANRLTDWVDSCDEDGDLSAAQLTDIETWLAAHFYAIRDPQYQSKATEKASASFQGKTGMGLQLTHWGQTAMVLDITGCLGSLNEGRKRASLTWLGKPVSEQTDYEDRD